VGPDTRIAEFLQDVGSLRRILRKNWLEVADPKVPGGLVMARELPSRRQNVPWQDLPLMRQGGKL